MIEIAHQLESTLRSLLAEELGEFRFGVPAIAIEPPQSPNTGTGLHVSIARQPKKYSQSLWRWEVRLRQYDRTDRGWKMFDQAVEKMRHRFPIGTEVSLPFEEDKFTQTTFMIDVNQLYTGSAIAENTNAD